MSKRHQPLHCDEAPLLEDMTDIGKYVLLCMQLKLLVRDLPGSLDLAIESRCPLWEHCLCRQIW